MFYLIYVSSATQLMEDDDLLSLLIFCRKANASQDITGMLLYKNEKFMQILEGEENAVKELYKSICEDSRHQGQYIVMSGKAEERAFNSWSMGFCNIDSGLYYGTSNDVETTYNRYFNEKIKDQSFPQNSKKAYEFISQFNRLNH